MNRTESKTLTEPELVVELHARSLSHINERTVGEWHRNGLLPDFDAKGRGLGQAAGRARSVWWDGEAVVGQAIWVDKLLETYGRFDDMYFPLWLLGYSVDLARVQAALIKPFEDFIESRQNEMSNWDERYRRGEHLNDAPLPLVVNAALQCQPGRALDLACGAGRHALWLAEHGWQVTAVDASAVAIELLRQRTEERGVNIDARVADLERGEFVIEPGAFDLIVLTCYLQRNLFPAIRAGVRVDGLVVAVIALVDDDPQVKPMNPAFLLRPGELRAAFAGWKLLHDFEGKPSGRADRRAMAELVARRSGPG